MSNRIEEHFVGIGPITPEKVEKRAREIAVINGRSAENYTEADLEQARRELLDPSPPPSEAEAIQWKHKVPVHTESAPKTSEDLVNEGLEEGEHDRSFEAHREDLENQSKAGIATGETSEPEE